MAQQLGPNSQAESGLASTPSDLHMLVLGWLNFHPDHTPEEIAKRVRAGEDVDEIAKLCADLAAAGFIKPMTWH